MATRSDATAVAPVSTALGTGPKRKRLPTEAIDNMPTDLLAGIGEVIARWGYLEFQLGVVIREACRIERATALLLTQRTTTRNLCEVLLTISASDAWVKDAGIRADMKTLGNAVKGAKDVRNAFAHGVFGYGDADNTFAQYIFKEVDKPTKKSELKLSELKADALVARQLWEKAQDLTRRLKALRTPRRAP